VLASKGLDATTGRPLSALLEEALPGAPVGAISGPCIAREVAMRVPTSVVAACQDLARARAIRDAVASPTLRAYAQDDLVGVEVAAAMKNVIAIAAGVGDGLGFGANSKSALMARGLAEMARVVEAMGGRRETTYGLAGMGDLAVTCFSPHSRNRTFGQMIGEGRDPAEARKAIGMVVEGEPAARAALALARQHALELPIAQAVTRLCDGTWTGRDAVEALMQRELKDEFGRRDRPAD
jgi:glycerol-3-phosphate dehydrogenase (NAD(P)+)